MAQFKFLEFVIHLGINFAVFLISYFIHYEPDDELSASSKHHRVYHSLICFFSSFLFVFAYNFLFTSYKNYKTIQMNDIIFRRIIRTINPFFRQVLLTYFLYQFCMKSVMFDDKLIIFGYNVFSVDSRYPARIEFLLENSYSLIIITISFFLDRYFSNLVYKILIFLLICFFFY